VLIREGLTGLRILLCYLITVVGLLLLVKRFIKVPQELTRKTLHLMIAGSVFVWLYAFRTWYVSAISAAVLAILLYPILTLVERLPWYSKFLSERRVGEVKNSMVVFFLMMGVLITVFWGWLGSGSKYIIVAAVMAWGFGDAAAALVGKAYGRLYITNRFVEGKKTVEGTVSMYAMSVLAIFITILLYTHKPWFVCLAIGLLVAPASALVELYTRRGMDTITVPLTVAGAVSVLIRVLDLFGV
jgi:phytol kinase